MSDNDEYFHEDPEEELDKPNKAQGKSKKATKVVKSVANKTVTKKVLGDGLGAKKTRSRQTKTDVQKNPFASPKHLRSLKVLKQPRQSRVTREPAKEKGLENFEDSPRKRVRRQIVQELEESDEESSSSSESSGEEEQIVEDQNSLEFVQNLANGLKGNEKESSFTEDQLDMQVVEKFSGCSMTLRQVLGLRAKLFQMYMSNQIPAGG